MHLELELELALRSPMDCGELADQACAAIFHEDSIGKSSLVQVSKLVRPFLA